jgi:hypothetical protein
LVDEVAECAERLLDGDGDGDVVAVDLVQVDPVVPSRRSESSTSRMIQRREAPRRLASSPIGIQTLVASTMSSRRPPARALPTISSDSPAE